MSRSDMHCKACHSDKLESDFYASNRTRCKECLRARMLEHRQTNIEKLRAYDRMRASLPDRQAKNRTHISAWTKKFPERPRANNRVAYAVRVGIIKPQPCWVCGEKAVAHHPDYDRPLDVVWLCPAHHKQTHTLIRKTEK